MTKNGILTGLIATCAACVISAAGLSLSQTSNRATKEIPIATVSVHAITGLAIDVAPRVTGITSGRARAMTAALVGLISLIIGVLALVRSRRLGEGRVMAIVALVLGLIGMVLSIVHLGTSTGGFGTGGGRAGAIVALVLSLIGVNLGGLALARSRRSRSID